MVSRAGNLNVRGLNSQIIIGCLELWRRGHFTIQEFIHVSPRFNSLLLSQAEPLPRSRAWLCTSWPSFVFARMACALSVSFSC